MVEQGNLPLKGIHSIWDPLGTSFRLTNFKSDNTLKRLSQLSHQSINVNFHKIYIRNKRDFYSIKKNLSLKEIEKREIKKVVFPKVIDNYLKYNS